MNENLKNTIDDLRHRYAEARQAKAAEYAAYMGIRDEREALASKMLTDPQAAIRYGELQAKEDAARARLKSIDVSLKGIQRELKIWQGRQDDLALQARRQARPAT